MPELFRLCDKISVLRDGQYVGTLPRAEATQDAVVKMMIGRSVAEYFPQHVSGKAGEVVLRVNNLSSPGLFRDINFEIRAGEIVALPGWRARARDRAAIFGLTAMPLGRWS
jgi:ABC-type sugar transport system ATPase subunit